MKCGSATTFGKLSRLFQDRGAILIDVALQPHRIPYDRQAIEEKISEVEADISPAFHFNLRRVSWPTALIKIGFNYLISWPRTIAGFMPIFYLQCATPRLVKKLLNDARIDYLYVNHYFSLPVAKLIAGDLPVFLDTHDIQSLNYVSHDYHHQIKCRAAPFTACLKEELKVVDKADKVTMVSQDEIDLVKRFRPDKNYFYYIPLPTGIKEEENFSKSEEYNKKPLQLLIVAARNPANERSLNWFLTAVWPSVSRLNAELNIVGGIYKSFEGKSFYGVNFQGVVENLEAAYESTDLVILPITNGGGIAIKTLEAIMYGKPIVASKHAVRGLPEEVVALLPALKRDIDFIADLEFLIINSNALKQRSLLVKQAKEYLISRNFDAQINQELDAMRQLRRNDSHQLKSIEKSKRTRFLLIPPASPGSKGDEGMMRGALSILGTTSNSTITILNPDSSPLWIDELRRVDDIDPYIEEVAGSLTGYEKQITSRDVLIFLGADVIDGTCGAEPSLQRLHLIQAASDACAISFVFCSFRSDVDKTIIDLINKTPGARYYLRDPVSQSNFERQTNIFCEYFPDFFSYCAERESSRVTSYINNFKAIHADNRKIIGINFSEHAFRSFFDEHTETNRKIYVDGIMRALVEFQPDAYFALISNDSRRWDNFPPDSDYQKFAANWLTENFPSIRHTSIDPNTSYSEILFLLRSTDLIITGRMHLALAAFRAGVLPIVLMGTGRGYSSIEKMRGAYIKYLGDERLVSNRINDLGATLDFYRDFEEQLKLHLRAGLKKEASDIYYLKAKLLREISSRNIHI
jgi:glycosyltransferase involved in cell wall biosynthesis